MQKSTGWYPSLRVDSSAERVVSVAGSGAAGENSGRGGSGPPVGDGLAPWRKPHAVHDPGKVLLDLALAVAVGGDCLADVGQLRSVPAVFGDVASDPTVSRLIDALATDPDVALAAIGQARAAARHQAWHLAGTDAPDHQISQSNPLTVDLDASLVTAHSEKELARPTYKRGFGFHPLLAFVDHGAVGTGEPITVMLRTGKAGANTADDHIKVTADALTQTPFPASGRFGREIQIRTDGAGGTHKFVQWLTDQQVAYSVGFGLCESTAAVACCWQGVRAPWTTCRIRRGSRRSMPPAHPEKGPGSPN